MTYSWQIPTLSLEDLSPILENRRNELLQYWDSHPDANDEDIMAEWMSLLQTRDDLIHEVITKENRARLTNHLKDLHNLLIILGEYSSCLPYNLQHTLKILFSDVTQHLKYNDMESFSLSRASSLVSLKRASFIKDYIVCESSPSEDYSRTIFTTPRGMEITDRSEYVTPCGPEGTEDLAFSTPTDEPVFSFSSCESDTKDNIPCTPVSNAQDSLKDKSCLDDLMNKESARVVTGVDGNCRNENATTQNQNSPDWLVVDTPQQVLHDSNSSGKKVHAGKESICSESTSTTIHPKQDVEVKVHDTTFTSGIGSVTSLESLMSEGKGENSGVDQPSLSQNETCGKTNTNLNPTHSGDDKDVHSFHFGDAVSEGSGGFLDTTPDTVADVQPVRTSTPRLPRRLKTNARVRDRISHRSKHSSKRIGSQSKKKLKLEEKPLVFPGGAFYRGSVWNTVTGMFNWYRGGSMDNNSQSSVKSDNVDTSTHSQSSSQSSSKSGSLQISID